MTLMSVMGALFVSSLASEVALTQMSQGKAFALRTTNADTSATCRQPLFLLLDHQKKL